MTGEVLIIMTTASLSDDRERQTRASLLAGIAVWFIALNAVYALPSLACKWGWLPFRVGSLSGLQLVQLVLVAVALAALAALIAIPFRIWRHFQTEPPPQNPRMIQDTEADRRPLLAAVVMGLNGFFFIFALALLAPVLTLRPCG